jgi:NAD(P)-dependent dehydrogenase (short-subunit alcohol dehydrogenase family)
MAEQGATQPPQAQSRQPGLESEMRPEPDFRPRYPGSGRLTGKVAIVTGGDSGIGRAVAVLFAREGASLVLGYLDEHEDAEETVRLVEEEGGRAVALPGDIGEPRTAERLVEAALDSFGRIDILVNNAAEQHEQDTIEDIDVAQLEKTFRTNIFGMFHLTKAALPHLGEGSSIINSASVTAYKGKAELLDYTSTKGAIVSFTRGLANQLVERGIRVNAVAPGPIWTPLIPASFTPEETAEHGAHAPMKRAGQPNEVAPSYLFLACEDASYMTGQVLHPNGGTVVNG